METEEEDEKVIEEDPEEEPKEVMPIQHQKILQEIFEKYFHSLNAVTFITNVRKDRGFWKGFVSGVFCKDMARHGGLFGTEERFVDFACSSSGKITLKLWEVRNY